MPFSFKQTSRPFTVILLILLVCLYSLHRFRVKNFSVQCQNGHLRMPAPVWRRAKVWLCQQPYILLRRWYALKLCCRSSVGHTRTLLSRKHCRVDLGSLRRSAPDGHPTANIRTYVREVGIQELGICPGGKRACRAPRILAPDRQDFNSIGPSVGSGAV